MPIAPQGCSARAARAGGWAVTLQENKEPVVQGTECPWSVDCVNTTGKQEQVAALPRRRATVFRAFPPVGSADVGGSNPAGRDLPSVQGAECPLNVDCVNTTGKQEQVAALPRRRATGFQSFKKGPRRARPLMQLLLRPFVDVNDAALQPHIGVDVMPDFWLVVAQSHL